MKQIRSDVRYLISAVLLVVFGITATTGLVADVWDLNDFVYHRRAGYTLAVVTLVHVYLHWNRLAGYVRLRLGGSPFRRGGGASPSTGLSDTGDAARSGRMREKAASCSRFSRRGFLGLMLGGWGGLFVGRGLRSPDLPYGSDVGEIYHEWSKPKWLSLIGTLTSWGRQRDLYKAYPEADLVLLPPPGDFRGLYTEDAIDQRRSARDYTGKPVTLDELSRLLYYTTGINGERWGRSLRAAPSAGALYPIEVYPVVHKVDGLKPGLYHYAMREHALERLRDGDLRGEIVRNGLMQGFLARPMWCSCSRLSSSGFGGGTRSEPTDMRCSRRATWARTCTSQRLLWVWKPVPSALSSTTASTPCWT